MKNRITILCMLLLSLSAVATKAQVRQVKKSSTFHQLPASINFTETQLAQLLNTTAGQQVNLPLDNNFVFSGIVTSNQLKYNNLQTVVIKLPAFSNTLLSLSKQSNNTIITYVGRIFNPAFADGFVLKKIKSSNYQLVKINTENILTDCSL